jgi:hypothetical protein
LCGEQEAKHIQPRAQEFLVGTDAFNHETALALTCPSAAQIARERQEAHGD